MVALTESAVQKIRELSGGGEGSYGLRVLLLPGGCCGTHYHFLSPAEANQFIQR